MLRHNRLAALVLTGLLMAGSLVAGALPAAAEESPRERVERLLPSLDSRDAAVRDQAEREIFALGDAGRREIERVSRDQDPRRAQKALRLLQSNRWAVAAEAEESAPSEPRERPRGLRPGERRVAPLDESLRSLDETLAQRMQELRRELRKLLRDQHRHFELPEFPELPELPELPDSWELPRLRLDMGGLGQGEFGQPGVARKGAVIRNGNKLEWSIDGAGRVKVTTRDGEDAEERTFEAESLEALRKSHPDVASRLDEFAIVRPRISIPRVELPRGWPNLQRRIFEDLDFEEALRDEFEPPELDPVQDGPLLGVTLEAPSNTLREHLRLPSGGVVVRSVVPGSLAERLGMKRHDVLLELAGRPIRSHRDVATALGDAPAGTVTAKVIRAGARTTLTATK